MTTANTRTALVTGATSGLGFDAAAQLAEAGDQVIVTGRNRQRAEQAARRLAEKTGRNVFTPLAVDLNDPADVTRAAAELVADGRTLDVLLLNAGMVPGDERTITPAGVEITFASSLIGHHQLTAELLAGDRLSKTARIVIAGSEAARGDVPTFGVTDLAELAAKSFDGDRVKAALALIGGTAPGKYRPGNTYADAKLFVAWWSAALARRLPDGMTVNAVSPGSAPDTDAGRNAPFYMRRIMMPVLKRAPARFGLAAPISVAASRYLEAADYPADVSGQFFASAPKKMTGPLHRVELSHFHDIENQEAAWEAVIGVAGPILRAADAA